MRILMFGTYDTDTHPRVGVLEEGLRARGHEVTTCNVPLGLRTKARVAILRRPWLLPLLAWKLANAWMRLWRRARHAGPVDAVVVGYLGQFDIHLARRRWPRTPIVLDYLVSGAGTARDRRVGGRARMAALEWLDDAALAKADVTAVDTVEHLATVAQRHRSRARVVPVGAPSTWFHTPERPDHEALRVVFFGLYTPLQGAPVIGDAIRMLHEAGVAARFTMIGSGQELDETRRRTGAAPVDWREWVPAGDLPALVAGHDVCLGIFGTGPKALRVVPNKVFQGAAAGCAVVTSDTPPQRRALDDAASFVPAGSGSALAEALTALAADPRRLADARAAAHAHADRHFRPEQVVVPLEGALRGLSPRGDADR
jgi:glycosyltransferase involved in cell wall biosynthesis